MPNELAGTDWGQAKQLDPKEMSIRIENFMDQEIKRYNQCPSMFLKDLNRNAGSLVGELSEPMGGGSYDDTLNKGPADSGFVMMGKKASKGKTTMAQLLGSTDGMGLDKTYKQKKDDAKRFSRIAMGVGKKSKDPLSQGDRDSALVEEFAMMRERMKVKPNGIKANPNMAAKLGLKEYAESLTDALREEQTATTSRVIVNMLDGNELHTNLAATTISKGVVQEAIKDTELTAPKVELLLGKEALDHNNPNALPQAQKLAENLEGPKTPGRT